MYSGSCLCGEINYELLSEPKKVSHCHCAMCQKQHGAAFATYASVPRSELVYISGQASLVEYQSSENIKRKFCNVCGSNIEWSGSTKYPTWTSIAIATLDTHYQPKKIINIQTESKACWLNINDVVNQET